MDLIAFPSASRWHSNITFRTLFSVNSNLLTQGLCRTNILLFSIIQQALPGFLYLRINEESWYLPFPNLFFSLICPRRRLLLLLTTILIYFLVLIIRRFLLLGLLKTSRRLSERITWRSLRGCKEAQGKLAPLKWENRISDHYLILLKITQSQFSRQF